MVFIVPILAALALGVPGNAPPRKHRRPHVHVSVRKRSVVLRSARELQFALLALRREMLHDFLVATGTEAPAFTDSAVVDAGAGLRVGPVTATLDFIGSPIVRARVRNAAQRSGDFILTATLRDANGVEISASTFVQGLGTGDSRVVELLCPAALRPKQVRWKVTTL